MLPGMSHISSNNKFATQNALNFFNKTIASLSTPENYILYNISGNSNNWVAYPAIKGQTSCDEVIKKLNAELWIEVGGNVVIGLDSKKSLFIYNPQNFEC